MKLSFSSKGGFENALDFLEKISNPEPKSVLDKIGRDGVKSLSMNTPRDTGATASGWDYNVETKNGVSEVSWVNNAHPHTSANVAVLIDKGHGTRNGGYVTPQPFISRSMDDVFKDVGDRISKELID